MKPGTTYKFGDIVLIEVSFVDKYSVKLRPALVLFEELDNIVVAGITSNLSMKGVLIPKEEGLIVKSVAKLNYIFTISKIRIKKLLTHLSERKKKETCEELIKKFGFCLRT